MHNSLAQFACAPCILDLPHAQMRGEPIINDVKQLPTLAALHTRSVEFYPYDWPLWVATMLTQHFKQG